MYPPPPPPPPPAQMSTSTKVVVALAVAIVGACAVCVGAGVVGGFWLKSQAPAMMEDVRDAVREGRAFAQGHGQRECVAEGVRRSGGCGSVDLRCAIRASGFLNACVRVAAATRDGALLRAEVAVPADAPEAVEAAVAALVRAGFGVREVTPRAHSLEAVFHALTRRDEQADSKGAAA